MAEEILTDFTDRIKLKSAAIPRLYKFKGLYVFVGISYPQHSVMNRIELRQIPQGFAPPFLIPNSSFLIAPLLYHFRDKSGFIPVTPIIP